LVRRNNDELNDDYRLSINETIKKWKLTSSVENKSDLKISADFMISNNAVTTNDLRQTFSRTKIDNDCKVEYLRCHCASKKFIEKEDALEF